MALAVRRVTRIAAEHRVWTLRAVAGLGAGWILCWAFGAELVSQTPIASASAASLLVSQANAVRRTSGTTPSSPARSAMIGSPPLPPVKLLTGLRGKDVLLLFVESYGKVAVQGISDRASGRRCSGQRRQATAGRRVLCPQRLHDLAHLRRDQLAGSLHPAVRPVGQHSAALQPASGQSSLHAHQGVRPGRLADGRRRAVGRPVLGSGQDLLPLRQALRPLRCRLPRSELRLRIDAGPVRDGRSATARAGQAHTAGPSSRRSTSSRATSRGPAFLG